MLDNGPGHGRAMRWVDTRLSRDLHKQWARHIYTWPRTDHTLYNCCRLVLCPAVLILCHPTEPTGRLLRPHFLLHHLTSLPCPR